MSDSWTFLRQGDHGEAAPRSETAPTGTAPPGTAVTGVTYLQRPGSLWARGGLVLAIGLPGFFQSIQSVAMSATHLGLVASSLHAAASVGCVLLGAWMWLHAWQCDLGITVTESGLKRTTLLTTYWAEWSSLAPFTFEPRRFPRPPRAEAQIEGQSVSRDLRKRPTFVIGNIYCTPLATMVGELNVWRQRGRDRRSASPTSIEDARPGRIREIGRWSAAEIRLAVIGAAIFAMKMIAIYCAH
jgi:hypothetical protein